MRNEVFDVLEEVIETDEFRDDLDADLFEETLLDSLTAIALIVELEDRFKVSLPPSEMERDEWNTANKIADRIQEKVNEKA
ncbi:D-alanine--poly(phosphoribitol) ligase subunit DltC [Weissella muntiaci]|uniref:D-alanyl carrier protein n=1 Tax=Weissella muntiaci TaxID=2508881 RepID=A0A6C2C7E7_9LACO|nr:D-alanine--poly(phosphoribitol) ligase subunit DltC [Weissella muntiaci]TYC49804.1 D-alanine--poly(phosphoribitol) ligase subunit DltC [Weissella muntiaci]